jgi:hypothetical protein
MTQPGLDRLGVSAFGNRERDSSVPQVMEHRRREMPARSTAGAQNRRPKVVRRRGPPSGARKTRSWKVGNRSRPREGTGPLRVAKCCPSSSARNAGIVTTRRDAEVLSGPTYNRPLTSEAPSAISMRRSSRCRWVIRSADASPNRRPAYAPRAPAPGNADRRRLPVPRPPRRRGSGWLGVQSSASVPGRPGSPGSSHPRAPAAGSG